jgi:hypothetical protein
MPKQPQPGAATTERSGAVKVAPVAFPILPARKRGGTQQVHDTL